MKKVSAPFISRYHTGRDVYKLMLSEAFVHVIRDNGLNVEAGFGANVVIQPDAKLKIEFSPTIDKKYRFIVRSVGQKLALSSKEFGPHILSEMYDRYKLCDIFKKDNCFFATPLTEYGEVTPVPRRVDIDQLRGELILADQEIKHLREQCEIFTKIVKGLLPTEPLSVCEKCLERPDTDSHFGFVTCGCHNLETYNEWNARQSILRRRAAKGEKKYGR